MTDKEKAVIMAHTGICMLTGEKFSIYHKYIEELMGRPVFTHELANAETVNQIKEKSKEDFLKLCKDEFAPEPCEDCVSRKDAIETAIEAVDDWDGGYNLTRADIIEKAIKALPPVQTKPKIGHWIYEKRKRLINETDESAEYVTDYWCKCSKCGGDFGYRKMKDAFCKYCGAKMVDPQESEEEYVRK